MGRAIVGGVAAGAFGCAIWVAIGYFLNAEVGIVAWGIGLIVGVGVAVGSQSEGAGPGLVATIIAVLSVLAGKYLVIYFLAQNALADMPQYEPTNEDVIETLADDLMEEKGLELNDVADDLEANIEDFYPPDVWAEAKEKFTALPPDEIAAKKTEMREQMAEVAALLTSAVRESAFKESFSPMDLLWFGLAAFTAFRVASGSDD